MPASDERRLPVVVVLVDDDHPQRRVVLGLERVEKARELRRLGPTVATTRSNDGSSRGTGRRLRDARADRATRLRPRRRARRGAVHARRRSSASCARPCSDLELIVVDDCSTDATPEHPRAGSTTRACVSSATTSSSGSQASLNRALDEARGRYVARMDADDAAFPDWLERCLRAPRLARRPRARRRGRRSTSTTTARRVSSTCTTPGRAAMRWRALFAAPVFHNTVVLEREVLESPRSALRHRRTASPRTTTSGRALLGRRGRGLRRGAARPAPPPRRNRPRGAGASSSARSPRRSRVRQIAALAPDLSGPRGASSRERSGSAPTSEPTTSQAPRTRLVELERTLRAEQPYEDAELACRPRLGRSRARAARARAVGTPASRCARSSGSTRCSRCTQPRGWPEAQRSTKARHARCRRSASRAGAPRPMRRRSASPPSSRSRRRTARRSSTASLRSRRSTSPSSTRRTRSPERTWRVEPQHRAVFLRGRSRARCRARPPPRLPAHARGRPALERDATRRRRRLRLEHVRGAGGDRLVPAARRPVRPRRREPRRGPASGLAPDGEGHRRAAGRRRARPASSSTGHARAQLDDRSRRVAGARADLREHRRRRGVRRARRSLAPRSAGPSCRARSGRERRTTSSCSPSRGSRPRRASTCSCEAVAAGRRRAPPARRRRARAPSGERSSGSRRERGVRARARRRRRLGANRRAVRRGGRVRAPLRAGAVGRRRERGSRVRPAARPLRPRRRGARPPPRRRERRARRAGDVEAAARAFVSSPPTRRAGGRMGARSRELAARLGVRAERRGLPRRGARGRRGSPLACCRWPRRPSRAFSSSTSTTGQGSRRRRIS